MARLSFIFALLLITILNSCTLFKQKAPETGVSKQLAVKRAKAISELEYNLEISVPDVKEEIIKGIAHIQFDLNKKQTLYLDFKAENEQLHQLIVNSDSISDLKIINEHIELPKSSLINGKNKIKVIFTAGDGALNRNDDYFYSLFVPDRARTAIPCFDQPDIKGSFAVTMDLPKNWIGIANGMQLTKQSKEGRIQLEFAPSKPISTYLWAFSAGKYQYTSTKWRNKTIGLYHMVEDTAKFNRNIDTIFSQVTESLNWLEDFTNFDYPFEAYNLIAIPSFQFGGMEHPGATYYRSELIFLDKNPTRNEELQRANLIAHETSHMWFGDLVTMPWFDDVWLKEVFANFMADKITEPWFPEMDYKLRFMLNHLPKAYAVDRTEGANPIGQKLSNLKNAGTLYGGIIYHKSPVVMKHLESIAGEENLKKGIQDYINNYAYGNASWNDLISCVDKYTETDLKVWSNAWVYEAGRPVIYFEPSQQEQGLWKLKQIAEHKDLSKPRTYWPQEITVIKDSIFYNYSMFDAEIKVEETLEHHNLLFLADEKCYGLVRLTAPQIDYWLGNAPKLKNDLLRGRMAVNLYENLLDGSIHPEHFMNYLIESVKNEHNPLLINLFTNQLQTVYWKFIPTKKRSHYTVVTENTLWNTMLKHENAAIKKTLFRGWSKICMSKNSVLKLGNIFTGTEVLPEINLSERDKISLLSQLYIRNHPDADTIQKQLMNELKSSNNKAKLRFLTASLSANSGERNSFFISLSKYENRKKEDWVNSALAIMHHPLRTAESINYLPVTLSLLEEIQITGDIFFPINWLHNSFSGHSSAKAYQIAETFLKNNPDYPEHLKLKILQNIDMVKRSSGIKEKYFGN